MGGQSVGAVEGGKVQTRSVFGELQIPVAGILFRVVLGTKPVLFAFSVLVSDDLPLVAFEGLVGVSDFVGCWSGFCHTKGYGWTRID